MSPPARPAYFRVRTQQRHAVLAHVSHECAALNNTRGCSRGKCMRITRTNVRVAYNNALRPWRREASSAKIMYYFVADFLEFGFTTAARTADAFQNCPPAQWSVKLLATLLITAVIKWSHPQYFASPRLASLRPRGNAVSFRERQSKETRVFERFLSLKVEITRLHVGHLES